MNRRPIIVAGRYQVSFNVEYQAIARVRWPRSPTSFPLSLKPVAKARLLLDADIRAGRAVDRWVELRSSRTPLIIAL